LDPPFIDKFSALTLLKNPMKVNKKHKTRWLEAKIHQEIYRSRRTSCFVSLVDFTCLNKCDENKIENPR
jgi:hypothetical protein